MNQVRVLVVSDTHLARGSALPDEVLRLADRADHVVHAGDFVGIDVLDTLEALAPVTAVLGNCDGPDLAARLPATGMVELAGVRIEVVHDAGQAHGRHDRLHARHPAADIVVYGHSHLPELARTSHGQLLVNPGSPTQRRRAPSHTVAWLDLADTTVHAADLVHLD